MKDNDPSLLQRLGKTLAGTAQQLLQQRSHPPEQTDSSSTPQQDIAATRPRQSFSSELFAELLIELPEHQGEFLQAYQSGDLQSLKNHAHRLLGAVVYCDAPELEAALRALQQALATNPDSIDLCYTRLINTINNTLSCSGYSGSI